MRDITHFSANVVAKFDNNYDNMLQFNELIVNAGNGIYNKYSKEETNTIIRNQMDAIFGGNFAQMTPMKRRQAWRDHGKEFASLIEDTLVDRMTSGWNTENARFMDLVEDKNLATGDKNEFFVADNSLLQVSQYAGNHHDVNLYSVRVA